MSRHDYVIVGAGLTGATIARLLHDAGYRVVIVERRNHVGGNVHDHVHPSGIRVHTYGPHYFRTNSARIWDFARSFGEFHPYEACLKSLVDGEYVNWPLGVTYLRKRTGDEWRPEFSGVPTNLEEAALSLMPRAVYEDFVKEYNEKQWGVPAHTLAADLCRRFDVRSDDDPRLKPECPYQGLPVDGYAAWMRRLCDGIQVALNCDYLANKAEFRAKRKLIYTGPIDEYFEYCLGKLQYRGQRRAHQYIADALFAQPCGQVNNPTHRGGSHIRTLEWKHMMPSECASEIRGTVLTTETPFSPDRPAEFEYPFPDDANANRYAAYRREADSLDGVLICGRLGEYRYYDMDQAIARAMELASVLMC